MTTQIEMVFAAATDNAFQKWVHGKCGGELANAFIRLAWRLHKRGFEHYSADAICHRLRWHYDLRNGPDSDGFKINNSHVAKLARFAMEREPRLKDFFETRVIKSKGE